MEVEVQDGTSGNIAVDALRRRVTVFLLAAALLVVAPGAAAAAGGGGTVDVVVRAEPTATADVRDELTRLGGRIVRELPIIDGFSARIDRMQLPALRAAPGVVAVTRDRRLEPLTNLGYDPNTDYGSLQKIAKIVGAHDAWRGGRTGRGIDIALIDTGVAPVAGLTSGNVIYGPDLSFESQSDEHRHLDTFGHGTHVASIIVGRDKAGTPEDYQNPANFTGIAPDARLVSVKVGAHDGGADVSQVIAAINWVAEHATRGGLNIRILTLAFGTDGTQDPLLDPLAYACEVAWRKGIVVVVAGGNDGRATLNLANPAQHPLILAAGAEDPMGTDKVNDDTVPLFASRGTQKRGVDLVAPGVSVLGLRAPGSFIDELHPSARVGSRFFRGSGTSQAAAVLAGTAALLLQAYPSAAPDDVKNHLIQSAALISDPAKYSGAGIVQIQNALKKAPKLAPQKVFAGTGVGSLDLARGTMRVADEGIELVGETDIMGLAWNGPLWAASASAGTTWFDGVWNGRTWTGAEWAMTWLGRTWTGRTWTGSTWTGRTWTGRTWTGRTWTSGGWSGDGWAGRTWTGRTWTDAGWASAEWK